MSKDEEYLRDFMAMFAMLGLITRGETNQYDIPHKAYEFADSMMGARDKTAEGIAAIKPKRKYERKA